MEKEFLTIAQLSTRLGVRPSTLYSWVGSGEIPYLRLGRRLIRFRTDEIDLWLESHRATQKDHPNLKLKDFTKDPTVDIVNNIVEEAIEDITGKRHTVHTGKPDRVKASERRRKNGIR